MGDDSDPQAKSQEEASGHNVPDKTDSFLSLSLSVGVPEKTRENIKKTMASLSPFWSDIKEFSHAFLNAGTERLRLSSARSAQNRELINRLSPESATLQAALFHVVEDQQTVEEVIGKAFQHLLEQHEKEPLPEAKEEIATKWLRRFRKEVEGVDEDEMKEIFARMLAGEIVRPGSFSIHALRTLGTLDPSVAKLFHKAVSMALLQIHNNQIFDARIPPLDGHLGENSLLSYGLGYSQLSILTEYGLLQGDYNAWWKYPAPQRITVKCQGKDWQIIPTSAYGKKKAMEIRGAAFTTVGMELLQIVEGVEETPGFIQALRSAFAEENLELREVG